MSDGHGGSYVINDAGERVLIERTAEGPQPTPATETPAPAGFFSPEETAPVQQPAAPKKKTVADKIKE